MPAKLVNSTSITTSRRYVIVSTGDKSLAIRDMVQLRQFHIEFDKISEADSIYSMNDAAIAKFLHDLQSEKDQRK
jgi:hypothetical protein